MGPFFMGYVSLPEQVQLYEISQCTGQEKIIIMMKMMMIIIIIIIIIVI